MSTEIYSFTSEEVKHSTIDSVLQPLNDIFLEKRFPLATLRKVIAISTEILENIANYSKPQNANSEAATFRIFGEDTCLRICASNYIAVKELKDLIIKIDEVNSLSKRELKPYFVEKVKEKQNNKTGGAGLGLIMIKRKSELPIKYFVEDSSKGQKKITLEIKVLLENMKTYRREETKHTPFVQFDLINEKFEIIGQSRPEDADDYYNQIMKWVNKQKSTIKEMNNPILHVDLEYYNSSSLKNLVKLFKCIIEVAPSTLKINWTFDSEDEGAKDEAIEISEIIKKEFTLIEKN